MQIVVYIHREKVYNTTIINGDTMATYRGKRNSLDYRFTVETLDDRALADLKKLVHSHNAWERIAWNKNPRYLRVKILGRLGRNSPHGTYRSLRISSGNCAYRYASRFDVYVVNGDREHYEYVERQIKVAEAERRVGLMQAARLATLLDGQCG